MSMNKMQCDTCGIRMGEKYKVKTFLREWVGIRIKSKGCIQTSGKQFCSKKCKDKASPVVQEASS